MATFRQRAQRFTTDLARKTDSHVIHMRTLRMAIGVLAFLLPVALVLGENARDLLLLREAQENRRYIELSISAYFHTGMRELFVGSLCAIAVFLVCYKGYERRDNLAANVAGFAALVVATFPTRERSVEATDTGERVIDSATFFSGALQPDPHWVGTVHFTAAAILFITLAVMSLLLFTRSEGNPPTPRKRLRNRVYVACGWTILASIVAIALGKLTLGDRVNATSPYVFWLEWIALAAFGISWLVKSELLLGDPRPD